MASPFTRKNQLRELTGTWRDEARQLRGELRAREAGGAPGKGAYRVRAIAVDLAALAALAGGLAIGGAIFVAVTRTEMAPLIGLTILLELACLVGGVRAINAFHALAHLRLLRSRVLFLDEHATSAATSGASTPMGIPGAGFAPNHARAARWLLSEKNPRGAIDRLAGHTGASAAAARALAFFQLGDLRAARDEARTVLLDVQLRDLDSLTIALIVGAGVNLDEETLAAAERACEVERRAAFATAAGWAAISLSDRDSLLRARALLDRFDEAERNRPLLRVDEKVRFLLGVDLDRLDKMSGLVTSTDEFHIARADRRLADGDLAGALREVSEVPPWRRNDSSRALQAEIQRRSGDWSSAKRTLAKLSPLMRMVPFFFLESGRIAELDGRLDVARGCYRRALEIDPECLARSVRRSEVRRWFPERDVDVADARAAIALGYVEGDARTQLLARLDAIRIPGSG